MNGYYQKNHFSKLLIIRYNFEVKHASLNKIEIFTLADHQFAENVIPVFELYWWKPEE